MKQDNDCNDMSRSSQESSRSSYSAYGPSTYPHKIPGNTASTHGETQSYAYDRMEEAEDHAGSTRMNYRSTRGRLMARQRSLSSNQ